MKTPKVKVHKDEDAERAFWATHSPLDYFDTSRPRKATFSNLKPSLKSISIRLPEDMVDELKVLANKRDVPYQSLAKLYLSWGIQSERKAMRTTPRAKKTVTSVL
ncbi:MAG: BrnA antitoxin family protein [Kiritimatiellia bacterium]